MRLVQEEHELGLVQVAGFGKVFEEVGEQPHEERREEKRLGLQGGQFEAADDAAAVGGCAEEFGCVELGFAEELLHALRFQGHQLAQDDAGRGLGQPAQLGQLGLAFIRR